MDWNLHMASSFDSHLIIIFRLMLNAMLLGAWKIKTELINFGKTEERLLFFLLQNGNEAIYIKQRGIFLTCGLWSWDKSRNNLLWLDTMRKIDANITVSSFGLFSKKLQWWNGLYLWKVVFTIVNLVGKQQNFLNISYVDNPWYMYLNYANLSDFRANGRLISWSQ